MSHSCQGSEMLCGLLRVTGYGRPWLKRDRARGALETCALVWRQSSGWVHSNLEKRETTRGKVEGEECNKSGSERKKSTEFVEKCVCLGAVGSFTICQNLWALSMTQAVGYLTDVAHWLLTADSNIDPKTCLRLKWSLVMQKSVCACVCVSLHQYRVGGEEWDHSKQWYWCF